MTSNPLLLTLLPLVAKYLRNDVSCMRGPGRDVDGDLIIDVQNSPIVFAHLAAHIDGSGPVRGCYQIKPGESVTKTAVLDLDSHKGKTPWPDMLKIAFRIMLHLDTLGIQAAPWRSGGGNGIHLWMCWDEAQDAFSVRETLRQVIEAEGFRDGSKGISGGQIEIFPKQNRITPGRFGSQVWLPLAGKSVPLIPTIMEDGETLSGLILGDRMDAGDDYSWPVSEPVEFIPRTITELSTGQGTGSGDGDPENSGGNLVPVASPIFGMNKDAADKFLVERLTAMLAVIPFDNEDKDDFTYETWLQTGMALHDATGGDALGLDLWVNWSKKGKNPAKPRVFKDKWRSFSTGDGGPRVTVRTLEKRARDNGWREDLSVIFDELDSADDLDLDDRLPDIDMEGTGFNYGDRDSSGSRYQDIKGWVTPYVSYDLATGGDDKSVMVFMNDKGFWEIKEGGIANLIAESANVPVGSNGLAPMVMRREDYIRDLAAPAGGDNGGSDKTPPSRRGGGGKNGSGALPAFDRDGNGMVKPSRNNIYKALTRGDVCGVALRHDKFTDDVLICTTGRTGEPEGEWRRQRDSDVTWIMMQLEGGSAAFKDIARQEMKEMVWTVAERNEFDSAQEWLGTCVWDGKPRVEKFLSTYMGAEDTAYTRAVARYIWSALAGRIIEPGVQADMTPVLMGDQGAGKTKCIKAIAPTEEQFCEINFGEDDDDLSRKMRGVLVVEIAELRGLSGKDSESIKAFLSRRVEKWIPKYKEHRTDYARRSLFFGSTNAGQFLADTTGNRRWLPFKVGEGAAGGGGSKLDSDGIIRDRAQLWAEGAILFRASGVDFEEAERLAKDEHEQFMQVHPWQEKIEEWLDRRVAGDGDDPDFVPSNDIFTYGLGMPQGGQGSQGQKVAEIMTSLGYAKYRNTRNKMYGWRKIKPDLV